VIRSFGARYTVKSDGSIDVIEDMLVDFTGVERHGIVRDIPVRFRYDDKHDREYKITVTSVTDGQKAWPFTTSRKGADFEIKVGDANKLLTGQQRYVITYHLVGALSAQTEEDELYWNVTGNAWPVPIERASAVVDAPSVSRVDCFEGPTGSTAKCDDGLSPTSARFATNTKLAANSGLTVVVGLTRGSVAVPPPLLVRRLTPAEQVRDFLGISPGPVLAALLVGVVAFGGIGRLWWLQGRDRWYGDVQYLSGSQTETEKPIGARETVVVEFAPPDIGQPKRPLRPAEVGVLMDERADTLDVSATIVDLAVRGYLKIIAPDKDTFQLQKLRDPDGALLPYETKLLEGLFDKADSGGTVALSDLKDHFYTDLAEVKKRLYSLAVKEDKLFPRNPETVRQLYAGGGVVLAAVGAGLTFGLGALGAGIVGLPVIAGGIALLALNGAMPRRSASGRELYRRALGFREYMVTAETDKAKFEEEMNLFEKYLPYAIVFRCTDKWAKAFEGLARQPNTGNWYVSPNPFMIAAFTSDIGSFSSTISSVMAATPSSSGRSGFGGGGFSGGGGGGGGGGSW
jgi:hypothetical protein